MIKYRKLGMLILSLITLSVFAAASATALPEVNDSIGNVPDLPLILRGETDVNGEPASAGSEIMAYYEGELVAKGTVGEEGRYNLNLNLTPENYSSIENVELYIDGDRASFEIPASQLEAIQNTAPGSIVEANITCAASSTDTDTGSGSSSGSTGEARIVNKGTDESETSEKSGSSSEANLAGEDENGIADAEGPVSQAGDEEEEDLEDIEGAEDAGGAEGTEDAGYSTVFTILIFAVALFGAFMVIKR